jgi:hypothetical protein
MSDGRPRSRRAWIASAFAAVAGVMAATAVASSGSAPQTTTLGGTDGTANTSLCPVGTTPGATSNCTYLPFSNVGTPGLRVPFNGTVTAFSISSGSAGGTVRLRVLRPAGNGQYTAVASSAVETLALHGNTFTTSLPVDAGDLIGLDNNSSALIFDGTGTTPLTAYFEPGLADGQSAVPNQTASGTRLLLSATVQAAPSPTPTTTPSTPGPGTGGGSKLPRAPNCGHRVPAYVHGKWRCVTAGPAINNGLTLIAGEVPGLRSAGHGPSAARTALGGAITAHRLGRAAAAARFRAHTRRLSTATFTLRTPAAAGRVIGSIGHGYRRLRRIGDEAKLKISGGRSRRGPTTALVVLRVSRAIAVVRLTVRSAPKTVSAARTRRYAATIDGDYAATLARRLTRVLALTPWQRNLDRIGPTGRTSKAVALRAFALQYGSLPHAKRPRGRTGAPASGTLAFELVAAVWSQLSGAQRSAIQRDLGIATSSGASVQARPDAEPVLTPDPADQALAKHWEQVYAGKLPSAPPVTIRVFKASTEIVDQKGTKAFADALPIDANGNAAVGQPMAYCRVRVPPAGQSVSAQFHNLVIAHEVFHCFQFALDPNWPSLAAWIKEGMADWAALTVDPVPASVGDGNFVAYLTTADQPLFGRAYDGVGFWGYADQAGGNGGLWSKIPAILSAGNGSSAAAFVTAGGASTNFLDTWASATLRYPAGGPPWNQTNPYALSLTQVPPPFVSITQDTVATAAPYAVGLYGVAADPGAPLISITPSTGTTRIANAPGGGDLGVVSQERWLCTDGDCECPPGTSGQPPKSEKVGGQVIYTAVTGGGQPGFVSVGYHSLDQYCQEDDKGGGPGGAAHGTGIGVYKPGQSGVDFLGDIDHGSCRVAAGAFDATASGGGYTMHAHVAGATKPNVLYPIPSNSARSYVTVNGYSSQGAPKTGVGGLKFKRITVGRKRRIRLSLGYDALFKGSGELLLAPEKGGLVC